MSSHILGIRSCAEDSFKLLPLRRDGAMSHLVGDNCNHAHLVSAIIFGAEYAPARRCLLFRVLLSSAFCFFAERSGLKGLGHA